MPLVGKHTVPTIAALVAGTVIATSTPASADDTPPPQQPPMVQIQQIHEQGAVDHEVTLQGFVTADYSQQGIGGFYVQAPGTGGQPDPAVMTSQAVHVTGVSGPHIGDYVQVTGTVRASAAEQFVESSGDKVILQGPPEGASAPTPITSLTSIKGTWTDEASLERIAGMLVMPDAQMKVSGLDQYGIRGEALLTPQEQKENPGRLILDDGAADEYVANQETQHRTLPRWAGDQAPMIGDRAVFTGPSVLQHTAGTPGESDGWHVQPQSPITDATTPLPARIDGSSPASEANAPQGQLAIAQVDLGNYFPQSGSVPSARGAQCDALQTADGRPLAIRGGGGCPFLGAADKASFQLQQSKVKALLTGLKNVDVIALQGLQNDEMVGKQGKSTAEDLANLMNTSGAGRWKAISAPQGSVGLHSNAFLYRVGAAQPVGKPQISQDEAFTSASSPLAQGFTSSSAHDAAVTVVSTKFSNQSGSDYDGDLGQDQLAGQNAEQRSGQAKALTRWLKTIDQRSGQVITGNLGSLDGDTPVESITRAGFTDHVRTGGSFTSQGSTAAGNLTHVFLSRKLAKASRANVKVWDIAAQSAPATGYASAGLNGSNLVDPHSAQRATSENPVLFALQLPRAASLSTHASSQAQSAAQTGSPNKNSVMGALHAHQTAATKNAATKSAPANRPADKDHSKTNATKRSGAKTPASRTPATPMTWTPTSGRAPLTSAPTPLIASNSSRVPSSTGSAEPARRHAGAPPAEYKAPRATAKTAPAADAARSERPGAVAGSADTSPTSTRRAAAEPAALPPADPTRDIRLGAEGQLSPDATAIRTPAAESATARVALVALAIALAVGSAVAVFVRRRRNS